MDQLERLQKQIMCAVSNRKISPVVERVMWPNSILQRHPMRCLFLAMLHSMTHAWRHIILICVIAPTAQICFSEEHFIGQMQCFVTNQLFTLKRIIGVKGESHIDCLVMTFLAPHPLGKEIPGNYPNSIFGNLKCNAANWTTAHR